MNRRPLAQDRRLQPRPSPRLQMALSQIGVPPERQNMNGIYACFPAEFKIEQSGFDVDTLADVLVHLVKSGVIKL